MDPYIERPAIWPDFHDCLIAAIRGVLQPLLRPKYAALTQDRLYVVQAERPIFPDVAVVEAWTPGWQHDSGAVAVLEPDAHAVFEISEGEEIREPFIEIIEPAAGERVVTAIEVLSPSNKETQPGRDAYEQKRQEYWDAGANLVEIDLLRAGSTTVRVPLSRLNRLRPWDYVIAVTRRKPARQEVYAFALERRLPRIAIPLANDDPDVVLDLQTPFARCWDEGPYPALLRYEQAPPGENSHERVTWCEQRLREVGFRQG